MTTTNSVNTYIVPTTANEVNMPSQPAFLAYLGTQDTNATGDGTVVTIGGGNALTEVFDQNSDFNTNGTFTAPVTGRYLFEVYIQVIGLVAGMNQGAADIVTSNRSFTIYLGKPDSNINVGPVGTGFGGSVLCDMDASDTTTFTCSVGGGAKVADIRANANPARTFVSGYLAV